MQLGLGRGRAYAGQAGPAEPAQPGPKQGGTTGWSRPDWTGSDPTQLTLVSPAQP